MCIEVVWDDAQERTIRMVFERQWTGEELYQAADQADELTASVDHRVAYLLDMRRTRVFPSGVSAVKVRHTLNFSHPNASLVVVVSTSLFVRTMVTSLVRVMGRLEDYLFLEDIDEARALIADRLNGANTGRS